MSDLSYGASISAKTGRRVPALLDGKAMYSLYAPERDARVFAEQAAPDTGFVVAAGVGDGSHIASLLERCPAARVIAVEHSEENLCFLRREFDLSALDRDPRVFFLGTIENLTAAILQHYIPVLHGAFALCFQEAWKRSHEADAAAILCAVEAALGQVKGDMATQAAFGRLWMRNILVNLGLYSGLTVAKFPETAQGARCIIAAAGPTMEDHLEELRAAAGGTFLLAVDTAYPALLRRGILPDGVVTIDGQALSAAHFLGTGGKARTTLFAELCCNPAVPRFFADQGQKVRFFIGNHPLCTLLNRFLPAADTLPQIATQSGTVTLAALDLAVQLGFQHIRIVGADFSYPHGKAYARGTYLDSCFYLRANRLAPAELGFAALLCRGTTVLDHYYEGAKKQISSYTVDILSDSARRLKSPPLPPLNRAQIPHVLHGTEKPNTGAIAAHSAKDFLPWYREQLKNAINGMVTPEIVASCLPLGAWEQKKSGKTKKSSVFDLVKLAYNLISRYN